MLAVTDLPVLEDLPDPAGKAVLVRSDLNVPLVPASGGIGGGIADDFRLRASVPTIAWLARAGARITVCSHLGRPGGRPDPRYAMAPVARRLTELVAQAVGEEQVSLTVMENLRFDPGEESNDPGFVDRLVEGQDLYVDDAFGSAHRAHASVVGPPARLPSAAGRVLYRETEVLGRLLEGAARPFVAVIGGAKVSDKIGLVGSLLDKAEAVMVGGGMCFTFLAALGHGIGDSLVEPAQIEACRALLDSGRRLVVPTDVVALGPNGRDVRVVGRTVPDGWKGLDIGPGTAAELADELAGAGTVFWNGPMGVFEDERFAAGTAAVARAVAECGGFTVVGGGDSAAALASLGLDGAVDHLSTGGGASLELLEKGDLPGLAALRRSFLGSVGLSSGGESREVHDG
ncbi:MAG: phosphoglycerate kinase [Acidimicrobiales bacterium]